jgi:hypothetical protein
MTQASAESIAQLVSDEARFPMDNLESAFRTLWNALATAVAFLLVNLDNVTSAHDGRQGTCLVKGLFFCYCFSVGPEPSAGWVLEGKKGEDRPSPVRAERVHRL